MPPQRNRLFVLRVFMLMLAASLSLAFVTGCASRTQRSEVPAKVTVEAEKDLEKAAEQGKSPDEELGSDLDQFDLDYAELSTLQDELDAQEIETDLESIEEERGTEGQ